MTVWIFAMNSKNMMIIRFEHPVKSSTTSLRPVTVCLIGKLIIKMTKYVGNQNMYFSLWRYVNAWQLFAKRNGVEGWCLST